VILGHFVSSRVTRGEFIGFFLAVFYANKTLNLQLMRLTRHVVDLFAVSAATRSSRENIPGSERLGGNGQFLSRAREPRALAIM